MTTLWTGVVRNQLSLVDINSYIGIPYGYRSAKGLDCYQLAVKVLHDMFGINAPDYEFNGEEDEAWIAFAAQKLNWLEGDGSPGDVVLLTIGKYQHCGVCLGDNQMIHTLRGHHSAIENYTTPKWRDRITGFYKWPR